MSKDNPRGGLVRATFSLKSDMVDTGFKIQQYTPQNWNPKYNWY